MIPREVRNLFRAKRKASKALKVVKSVKRCLALRKRIASIDFDLKKSYENRKRAKENEIFEKSKSNINVLYGYIKKKQKKKCRIGPFLNKKGEIIDGRACDILNKQ